MMSNRKIITFISTIFSLILYILNLTNLISDYFFGQLIFLFAITFAFAPIIESAIKRNVIFTILFLFIFSYTYTLKYYYFDKIWISFHQVGIGTVETMNQLTIIVYIFNMLFWSLLKLPKNNMLKKPVFFNNNIIFFFNILIFTVMAIFGNTSETIFNSGGYHLSTGTGNRNSLTEYAIIFLAASFLYSGNSKKKIIFLYIITTLYCLKNLLQGGRIETVMVLFVILVFDLIYRFSFGKIMTSAFFVYSVLSLFSYVRDNPENILRFNSIESVFSSFFENANSSHISNNQGDVLFASERMLLLIRDNVLDTYSRVKGLFYFILTPFVPFKYLPPTANLSNFKTDLYTVGGGGLGAVYFFVYLSYTGVFLFSFIVTKAFKWYLFNKRYSFLYFYGVFVVITIPRWYAYNPVFLIKFCIIGAVYLYLLSKLKMHTKNNDNRY